MKCGRCIHVADIASPLDFRMYTLLHLSGKGNKPPQSAGNVVCVCVCVRACVRCCCTLY